MTGLEVTFFADHEEDVNIADVVHYKDLTKVILNAAAQTKKQVIGIAVTHHSTSITGLEWEKDHTETDDPEESGSPYVKALEYTFPLAVTILYSDGQVQTEIIKANYIDEASVHLDEFTVYYDEFPVNNSPMDTFTLENAVAELKRNVESHYEQLLEELEVREYDLQTYAPKTAETTIVFGYGPKFVQQLVSKGVQGQTTVEQQIKAYYEKQAQRVLNNPTNTSRAKQINDRYSQAFTPYDGGGLTNLYTLCLSVNSKLHRVHNANIIFTLFGVKYGDIQFYITPLYGSVVTKDGQYKVIYNLLDDSIQDAVQKLQQLNVNKYLISFVQAANLATRHPYADRLR